MSERAWQGGRRDVQSFRYPAIQPAGFPVPEVLGFAAGQTRKARDTLQQELSSAVEAARKKAFQEGQAHADASHAKALDDVRRAIAAALHDFEQQRTEYFRRLESEAVRLALSIARKILHREAQMDPLLLAGVVRVALDQMHAGTRLVLRTSPESARSWAEFCSHQLQPDHNIEVVPDSSLAGHRCILQADVGSTEISLDAQLGEIESGFFDLLRAKSEEGQ